MSRQLNTDCEGPITKNDNAMELCEYYIPGGKRFFSIVSRYDDYLADVEKRAGYKAGDTLKLILPFLKAFGASDEGMKRFSRENIILLPGAAEMLRDVSGSMEVFIISTSYRSYIDALCDVTGFPRERTFSTEVFLDSYPLGEDERKRLVELAKEIEGMPMIELNQGASCLEDLSDRDRKTIQRLDCIFWEEIREMEVGRILSEVNPVGGREKANAILSSLRRTGNRLEDVMYVGDSITDVEAFDMVRDGGGLTVSFNGNRFALRSAEVACLSSNAFILAVIAKIFVEQGKLGVLETVENWSRESLAALKVDTSIFSDCFPVLTLVDENNRLHLVEESESFRKRVRGIHAGSLG